MDAKIDNILKLQKRVDMLSKRGIPIAIQQTINNTTRTAWKEGRKNTSVKFKNRNAWTKRSENYTLAEGLDPNKMAGIAGTSAAYLAEQETGFTRSSNGSAGVWVPTAEAADQTGDRTRPIRPKYRKGRIRLKRKIKKRASSPAQARMFKILDAVMSNGMFWGKLGNTQGMWNLTGSIINRRIVLVNVRLLYSANKRSITTRPHVWHETAVERAQAMEPMEYQKALNRQIARLKMKGKIR